MSDNFCAVGPVVQRIVLVKTKMFEITIPGFLISSTISLFHTIAVITDTYQRDFFLSVSQHEGVWSYMKLGTCVYCLDRLKGNVRKAFIYCFFLLRLIFYRNSVSEWLYVHRTNSIKCCNSNYNLSSISIS